MQRPVAIITGASSGIGKATALMLAGQGHCIVVASRNQVASLEEVAAQARALGSQALVVPADLTDRAQAEQVVAKAIEHFGQVDLLVASVGLYVRGPILDLDAAEFQRSIDVNFYGNIYPALAVLPHMLERRQGHVIFINSLDAKFSLPRESAYVITKHALSGFADVLRQELRGSGVSVTTIYPARVDTPLIETLRVPWISPKMPPEAVARAVDRAMRRKPAEILMPLTGALLYYISVFFPFLSDWIIRISHLSGWGTEGIGE